ncbi:MAG: BTAD domain-containing putative transcriptional regulator [Acidimicrobiia bacterium]
MGPPGQTDPLEVLLLGPVEVRVGGRPVPLPGVSQRVVLARLAVAAGRLVPTGELVDALWPGGPPENGLGNLQSYLSRLRKAVGPDRVTREPGGYRLSVAPEAVDVGQVEATVAQARAVAGQDPGEAARLLGDALDRWRGDPLADLPDALPFAPEVARWAAWRRQLVEDRLRYRIAAGHDADVLPELEQAAAADPTSERVHLLWMEALHHLGRTADALRVADRFRRRLVEETGLDPSPALAELESRLLAGGDAPRPAPGPVPPPPHLARRFAPGDRFCGRAGELATLAAAVESHRVVTLVGPGGVGKTRLVLELLDRTGHRWAVHLVELGAVSEGGAWRWPPPPPSACGRRRRERRRPSSTAWRGSPPCSCWTTASTCWRRRPHWSPPSPPGAPTCASWPRPAGGWEWRASGWSGSGRCPSPTR